MVVIGTCQVIHVSTLNEPGSDFEEQVDKVCGIEAVGTTEDGVRVCEDCAEIMVAEQFVVAYDDYEGLLDVLLERARALPPPTARQRDEQTLSFAWGNLAATTNHKPTLVGFERLAAELYGWSSSEFREFATRMGWV